MPALSAGLFRYATSSPVIIHPQLFCHQTKREIDIAALSQQERGWFLERVSAGGG